MHIHSEYRPLVSVIMGIRYQKESLEDLISSINSILTQTYNNIELLICQNESTSSACELLENLANRDDRIKLVDGKGAYSLATKLNRCLAIAKGVYIARQDDDDISYPERLQNQVNYLNCNKEIGFVGCNVELKLVGREDRKMKRVFPEYPTSKDFLFVQPFIHPTLMFRRTVFDIVKGYCEKSWCDGCEDYDLLLRMYENGVRGKNLQGFYFQYTVDMSKKHRRTFLMRCNEVYVRWKRFSELGFLPKAIPYVIKPVIIGCIPNGLLNKMKRIYWKTLD